VKWIYLRGSFSRHSDGDVRVFELPDRSMVVQVFIWRRHGAGWSEPIRAGAAVSPEPSTEPRG
jgi:hypothetical protein